MRHDSLVKEMVRRIWPDAPIAEHAASGRWVRLQPDDARMVYVQHLGWDDETRPDFIVVWRDRGAGQPVATRRFADLDAAIEAVRFGEASGPGQDRTAGGFGRPLR